MKVAISTVLAAFVTLVPLARADDSDSAFISVLNSSGVPYDSRSNVISLGHEICEELHDGVGFSEIARIALNSGFTPAQGGDLMGASVGAYCPDLGPELKRWVANAEPG